MPTAPFDRPAIQGRHDATRHKVTSCVIEYLCGQGKRGVTPLRAGFGIIVYPDSFVNDYPSLSQPCPQRAPVPSRGGFGTHDEAFTRL
jgi:hypothetical protein